MNSGTCADDHVHLLGETATHPIELRGRALAALLLLAGTSPQRRRALPAHRRAAHSGASNCRFQAELLTERGFQVTGIDEVLKRVGVPKGSFHHFFANKHGFGEAVIQNYVEYCARKMARIFDDAGRSPLLRLRLFVPTGKLYKQPVRRRYWPS